MKLYKYLCVGLICFCSCSSDDDSGSKPQNEMTDARDGQVYKTAVIGPQTWFAENLNFSISPSWSSGDIYGRLYKWTEAVLACPSGWHLPSDNEWKRLEMYLGMRQSEADGVDYRGTDEGSKLKSTSGWDQNGNGTNSSGFSALPGGYYYGGTYYLAGNSGYWWTSSIGATSEAWARTLFNTNDDVFRYDTLFTFAFSVRCKADAETDNSLKIGDPYGGDIIAYILQPGDQGYTEEETHGLIAASNDQSTGSQWGCVGTEISGADGLDIGSGNQNTIDIEAGCASSGTAADICANLTLNGYTDWYLPNILELAKLI